jgi:hypothetical protein
MAAKHKQGLPARANEPVSDLVVISIADGTVDWVFTDLNIRVLVVEPDLLPVDLDDQVRDLSAEASRRRRDCTLLAREFYGSLLR